MGNFDKQYFLNFILNNKNLTRAQIRKRNSLLVRDCLVENKEKLATIAIDDSSPISTTEIASQQDCMVHEPQKIVAFLHQFTDSNTLALKYTSHFWDRKTDTGEYPYSSFREFKKAYMDILEASDGHSLDSIRLLCEHLWQIIRNFLVNDDAKYPWSQYKLKIGYNKYLEEWMDSHPGNQPFSMPISSFPQSVQPKTLIEGKTLVYFSDVVDIFKRCIEFRDNDLFFSVMRIFKESPDHKLDMKLLNTLRGRSMYTDTELVNDALRIIARNIFHRSTFPELKISCKLITANEGEAIQLRILQVGSFSDKDVNDPKILAQDGEGDLARIKTKLLNLCDFSVESRFRIKEELKFCRINYLSSIASPPSRVEEIEEQGCEGFTYILTFYSYKHE